MNLKKVELLDLGMIKWSSILFTLFVVSAWPGFTSWVVSTSWYWFLIASLLLAIRPTLRILSK